MSNRILAVLFGLSATTCGSPPEILLETPSPGFEVQSSCYTQRDFGTYVSVSILAYPFPSGCDAQARLFLSQGSALRAYSLHKDREQLQTSMEHTLSRMPDHDTLEVAYYGPPGVGGHFRLEDSTSVGATTCTHPQFENSDCTPITVGTLTIVSDEGGLDVTFGQHRFRAERSLRLEVAQRYLTYAILEYIRGP